jgi:dUTPase
MLTVKFKKKDGNTLMPVKGSENAACYDVYAHSITFPRHNKVCIGLGFSTEIPEGYKGIIVPRSNLTKHEWVMNNSFGVIDSKLK